MAAQPTALCCADGPKTVRASVPVGGAAELNGVGSPWGRPISQSVRKSRYVITAQTAEWGWPKSQPKARRLC